MIRIKSENIILKDRLFDGFVYFEDGIIKEVTNKDLPFDKEIDAGKDYVSPGFIDLHTHGGAGFDFINGEEDVIKGSDFHLTHGTTSILPTISAAPFEKMAKAVIAVDKVMKDKSSKANIIGAHLEGPYLSKDQCGAQCTDFITNPKKDEYENLVNNYKDAVARWSYAPENDKDGEFAKFITENGIVASAGHTNAIYDDMKVGMENGLNLVTHLFSCTSTITRDKGFRRLGVIETAFLEDDLYVEIIADGKHLPPELIKLIIKNKGIEKTALVTDSLSLAGTDAKQGKMVDTEYIIEDGVCKLLDRSAFAGSIATSDRLVRVIRDEVGFDIVSAVYMMTKVPANILGLKKGEIKESCDADIIIFDKDINVKKVFVMGSEK
ncbi:MAG: N-acetylglucosamine-6-phosphate deacetylase [Ruminococcaceae bacterium]|nr:N-acetylglucosamine-6-phosphate deacetylase [Oscillospiraceae bacterium]